ncbi:hypothetical protein PXH59_07630 [Xenorhabdus sp. SF857]|uniref:hypothetical protein n=1 Tax=Xenorhabdus bakwenae TaxID=3026967 RepID=UPI0025582141|nr:hypothetical protein [Xenorhabdus sp. SF857]WFQ80951.1 hypothetical protein PXH59_07630 [Xenorhabdus sp. SF857]
MKTLKVTVSGLTENNTANSVNFKIWQHDKLLVEDTLKGKISGEYTKAYDVDCSDEPIRAEHNRNDLLSLKITVNIA